MLRVHSEKHHLSVMPLVMVLEYVSGKIDPIGSEDDLQFLERLTVENMGNGHLTKSVKMEV